MQSFREVDLFVSGEGGYHTYRIPSLIFAGDGTLLAFCEGRRDSRSDYGKIDILLRRSRDNGEGWDEPRVVVTDGEMTCGNPCPVLCQEDGRIWLSFCKNGGEASIIAGEHRRTVWLTASRDGGENFTPTLPDEAPVEPTCQASVARLGRGGQRGNGVLFSNPTSTRRERMTVRLS